MALIADGEHQNLQQKARLIAAATLSKLLPIG